jgi:hypothetical protein
MRSGFAIRKGRRGTMAVVLPVFPKKFRTEGEIIGRLVVGYGELEIDLCRCIAAAVGDLNMVVRKMFGLRGETLRVNTAVCIGKSIYELGGLGELFDETICGMRRCLKIRNQYAHCNFYDDDTGKLAVVDVEELVQQDVVIEDFASLTVKHLTHNLLKEQEHYFLHIRMCLDFLNCEGRVRAGTLAKNPFAVPEKVNLPQTHIA